MAPSRLARVVVAFLLLIAIPSFAAAATTEFRVLFDVDNDPTTGCTVNGMDGVDQVLVTQVSDDAGTAHVTRTHREICTGTVLGGAVDIVTTGWDAGFNNTNKLLTIETRIPFSAFGSAETMPSIIRAGFDASRNGSVHTSLANQDGTPIEIPEPPARRRAIGAGEDRHIIMDGALLDWGRIKPAVIGLASNGSPTLRLLRILAWPDTGDHHLYFAVTAYLGSDHPYADDNMYLREPGQNLMIGAPGVLSNDAIPGGAPLTAQKVTDPSRGTVTLNADGSFTYSPNHPQVLTDDEFEYKAVGGGKESNVARVVIQVNQNENPNVPHDDTYSTREDKVLVEAAPGVLANDEPNPNVLDATLVTAPLNGTVVLNKDGGFTYTPKKHFFGDDKFVYKASKKEGSDNGIGGEATVTIHVESVNDAPTFTPGPSPVTTTIGSGPFSGQWATNISPGPNNESGQTVNFIVSNNNNALFSVQPQISASGVLTFTPAGSPGSATVSVQLHDNGGTARGGSDTSPVVTFVINVTCGGTITVTNPANSTGTANAAFSETFTQVGGVGATTFSLNSGTLPAGLTLAPNGVLSGTPTQTGSFPITVAATDSQGCIGVGPTYPLTIGCQIITVTNPANGNGTAGAAFSETFTQAGGIGTTTFTLASGTLPAGLTLAPNGVLSGTPTVTGSFPITVTATDANGCTGTGTTYTITIGCQTITVNTPANGNGAVSAPFSETFTQTGAIGTPVFTLASGTLPAGLALATNGTVSGTPTQTGSFPITVTVTDANGCTGTSATYTIIIGCQTITVTNPANTVGTVSAAFSETFTQSGAVGGATFTLNSGVLPAGLTLAANGTLSGTPTQQGSFPITVLVTDGNGCTGVSATYNLVINCQTITVTNPSNATGPAGSPFSETFTQTGAVGSATFTLASGVLPTGLTLAPNGVLSGTPTQGGAFPITVTVTDANGCTGTGPTYTLVITCPVITVNNPANGNGTASSPFSETFTSSGGVGTMTYSLASGTLPAGLTLAANGVLSGTPTQTGAFPITVMATDANGCTGTGTTYTINIACQTITVTNPVNGNGTAGAAFSETFNQTGGIGTTTFSLATGTLPAGLTLAPNGVLSGTPTQTGSFPITVTATDSNGCTGTGTTYTITIACQTINVGIPANNNGTVSAPFSETFTQTGAIGTATFTTASTLPAGLTLATNGVLSGTPTQTGTFPIVVTVTDSNGCTGTSTTYNLTIGCQTITVTNPSNTAGTVNAPFNETFTQTGGLPPVTFSTVSPLPPGMTLGTNGVLSGTPTQPGTYPIVVTATDVNGCTGTSATYTLVIGCQTITVTNPSNATGPAGSPFSETFTQTGAVGTATFTTASTLPTGLTLSTAGVLSGTPTQGGTFPIVVTVTDSNGCTGTGSTYTLVITCPVITVNNPVNGIGTASSPFSETFTASGGIGTYTYALATGTLPAGLTLAPTGVLSGTPTQTGSFQITVTATDSNGCTGTGTTYIINIACQTITVNNPANGNGTAASPFSETFTHTGGIGTTTFTLASGTLPAGLTLASNGTLSGTPTQTGSFPITVTATDSNNCTGTGTTYTITIACQVITVNNPANGNGTAAAPFSETFTQTGGIGTTTFSLASGTLPAGLTLASNGTVSGTPTQTGSFPITVTATDSNGCTGTSATYTITIACQTITVTNPANASGTVNAVFNETFTQVGAIGTATFTTASTLPAGLTLGTNGVLSGTPTQSGTFPIVVTVTDSNGCTGTGATYNLTIACQTITVNNPGVNTGTAGTPFSQMFTHTGGVGTTTFSTASTLPAGLVLQTDGTLAGTPTQVGTFPIVVTATDSNGCTGTGTTYNLTIACQTITVTNPATTSIQAGQTLGAAYTFTATGILGTANWTLESGTLPAGITLNATSGQLEGSSTVQGSYPITVRVTDTNGCFDISDTYTLDVVCPVITPARTGGGLFPNGTYNTAYAGQSFTASGGTGPYTFAVTGGTFPTGLTLASNGTISGTPTQTGTFVFTVTATDASLCPGSASFSIAISPSAGNDTYNNLVNNTQAVVTGGTTASPATPFVPLTGALTGNDQPSGGVTIVGGTFATTQGGSVTIASDGTFIYTPPVTVNALTTDSFNYTISSNTGGTGTPTQAIGLATLNLVGRVWYVRNDVANGDGRSHSPFNSTSSFTNGARSGPDKPGDIIHIHKGDSTTTNMATGVVLLDNEQLIGHGVALVVNTHTLVPADTKPLITNSTPGPVVTLGNGNTVRGLTITGGTDGITGTTKTAFTGGDLTLTGGSGSGLSLTTFAGAVTLTNTTITNNAIGVTLNGGSPTVTIDGTNSITANAGQRSINFANLGATASVGVGAPITDNGLGISVSNSASGAAISFTGTQTLGTTTNTAVSLTTNTGAAITFSGTLAITSSTGSGFVATGGGTLNVSGTANITTGAAAAALSLNGMTVGGSGVAFNSVNATGPTTGISLVNLNGTVSVNGGTINNAGTGVNLQGASTSLSLAGVTIGGTTTTGITNTTNFGTLTIGASVSVSATTALNLTTGTVTGTFASVSSTGGTNGVNLNAVSGTWGTTAGALTGASGATFNVSGTAGAGSTITWGGTITQNNAATAVTISAHNRNVTFNGNITTGGTSTGISLASSSGTYLFNGTNTIAGSGGGIAIGLNQSGTITFSNNSSINTAGTAFSVAGGGGAVTAAITYGGTITKNSGGILISVDNLDSPGTLSMTHTPSAAGNISQNSNGAMGISIINSSSTNITIENASVTFQNANPGFTASGNTGGTINLPGLALTGTGNKGGMLISGAGTINVNTGAANPSINLSGGNNAASKAIDGTTTSFTGTLNLTNVTITGNATANADTVTLTGGTLGGTGSTISGANRALVLSGVDLTNGAGMTSVTSSGGANGISLTNVTGGPYTISGGSLTSNTGASFLVSGGTRTITYNGSITQNTGALRAVDIQNSTGGTIAFTGAVGSTAGGVFMQTNTGTTMSYRGGLVLSTGANAAFTATGGGTLEVCDENPCNAGATGALVNTITTTTGTALNVANTNIGANNLEFQAISAGTAATGPTNGIVLNTTGSGGLKVKGTGAAGTGGTIQRTTGVGILMTTTTFPSFNYMNIQNAGDDGIRGSNVSSMTLNTCNLSTNGNATAENGLQLGEASGAIVGITGTLTITNTNITASAGNNVHIRNTSGSLTAMNITGGSFNDLNDVTGANSFLFEMSGTASTAAATISGGTQFHNNSPQRALEVQTHDSGVIVDFTVNGASFNNNGIHASFTQDTTSNLTFKMLSNNMQFADPLHAINVFSSSTATGGSITGTIEGNTIGTAGSSNSGAKGNAIRIALQGRTQGSFKIHNNTIRQVWLAGAGARGMDLQFLGPTAAAQPITQSDILISNNDIDTMAPASAFPLEAIFLSADNQGSPARVRAQITGNNARNSVAGGSYGYPTFDGNGAHLVFLENLPTADGQLVDTGAASANALVELQTANPATTATRIYQSGITLIPGPISTP